MWIGFKHLMYLMEEAVLGWFRQRGYGPQRLFRDYAGEWEILDASVTLPSLIEIDDEVSADVKALHDGWFSVRLSVHRADEPARAVLIGKVQCAVAHAGKVRLPADLEPFVCSESSRERPGTEISDDAGLLNAWQWRARYFHCQYSNRLQYSAHVRALEEVVDRFLTDREMSIGTMLTRMLIPVVSRVSLSVIAPVRMEETVYTTFRVDEVLKGIAFNGRMDSYVRREGRLTRVSTGRILHGYAMAAGPQAGALVPLDAAMITALTR
jgi:acyl-CoA thioesterase FadM